MSHVAGSTDTTGVFCLFKSSAQGTTVSQSFADQTLAPNDAETFAMTGTATVGSGLVAIELECQDRTQPSTSSYFVSANLIAQQVGLIH